MTYKRRIKIDGILYPYRDADQSVEIPRKLHHIWKGQRGKADDCMNFHCIVDNSNLFPHPVIAVHVIKSRVFLFESPEMVVRYVLARKDVEMIGQHDEVGVAEPGMLVLHAPIATRVGGAERARVPNVNSTKRKPSKQAKSKGAKQRLEAVVGAAARS